jgi:hypothetical protein
MLREREEWYMSRLQVLRPEQNEEWIDVLRHSQEYDSYHLPQYHTLAEEQGKGEAHLFVYREGDYCIAVPLLLRSIATVPCHAQTGNGWRDATSVYGYAGPVASHSNIPESVLRGFRSALREALVERRIVFVFSRLHPLMSQAEPLAGMGECVPVGKTVSIDLTLSPEMQRARYRKDYRRQVNKLRRLGVTCLHDWSKAHLDEFINIYHETMHRVGACESYLYDHSYFEHLTSMLGSSLHLFICQREDRVLSGGLFLLCGGILQAHLVGSRSAGLAPSSTKLLFDTARLWANDHGVEVLHLGGGVSAQEDSLFFFKAGFSDRRHEFAAWTWMLFPHVHDQLSREREAWRKQSGLGPLCTPFYPTYRCPNCPSRTQMGRQTS